MVGGGCGELALGLFEVELGESWGDPGLGGLASEALFPVGAERVAARGARGRGPFGLGLRVTIERRSLDESLGT